MTTLKFDAAGLIPAICQDALSGEIRMVAWMNEAALAKTLESGRATFYSRSRQRLWCKGESSGHWLVVESIFADCDSDTLLLKVDPAGPSCHTGRPTCFFRRLTESGSTEQACAGGGFLDELEREIADRDESSTTDSSYTKYLLGSGAEKIGEKLREESSELAEAIAGESAERVASESADVLYHLLVGLRHRGVSWRSVIEVLRKRSGVSGHVEKASRVGG